MTRGQKRAFEYHVDSELPIVGFDVEDGSETSRSRDIEYRVQRSECADRQVDGSCDVGLDGDVTDMRLYLLPERLLRPIEARGVHVEEKYRRAFVDQLSAHRRPDT